MTTVRGIPIIVLLIALFISTEFVLTETELPERKPYLAPFQDAWKALILPGTYFLYMRSYAEEPFYGFNRKCVFSQLVSFNEKENYTTSIFGSTDPKDGSLKNITAYAWARASEGYGTPNIMEASSTLEKDFVLEYGLIFSEYDNCEILRLPHRKNGCELWAKAGKMDKISSLCFFVYHLLCGPEKHIVYDRDLCEKELNDLC